MVLSPNVTFQLNCRPAAPTSLFVKEYLFQRFWLNSLLFIVDVNSSLMYCNCIGF